MAITVDSLFASLLEFSWRRISVPLTSISLHFEQDQVEHKWPDRDGAHVEATGRAPIMIEAKIPLRNFISNGVNESFVASRLYPQALRAFMAACADRTTGELQHPELGVIQAKCKHFEFTIDATRRDGVDLSVSWVESSEKPEDLTAVLASSSPATNMTTAATDVDSYNAAPSASAIQAQLKRLGGLPTSYEPSLTDLARSIQAIPDQYALLNRQLGGQIDHFAYRMQAIVNATNAAQDATFWPIKKAAEIGKAAANDIKKTLSIDARPIGFYTVPTPQSMASVATTLQATVSDLVKLNPILFSAPVISAGTKVRYYRG